MRTLILTLLTALMLTQPATAQRVYPEPKLYALYFYADWCTNCKILGPKVAEARNALAKQDILFVTFDLTDKPRIHNTILHAQALGAGDYLKAQGSSTGYLAVLDAKTKKEVARFDSGSNVQDITNTLATLAN